MKQLNIRFDDKDFKRVFKVKQLSGMSWEKFILLLVEKSLYENQVRKNDF